MKLFLRLFIIFLWIAPIVIHAQVEKVDLKVIEQIKQEGYQNSGINEFTIQLVDAIGPRLSGSSQLAKANQWAKSQLQEIGLSNVRIEPWGEFGKGWENEKFYIAMTSPYYQPLIAVPQAWSGSTNGLIRTNVVVLDIKNTDDFEKYRGKLQGKVVTSPIAKDLPISFEPMASRFTDEQLENLRSLPEQQQGGRRMRDFVDFAAIREMTNQINEFLKEEGVAAIINSSGSFGTVRSAGGSRTVENPLPQVDMTYEHHARMVRLLERGIDVEIELEIRNRFLEDDLMGYNVIGEIPGTDRRLKNQVVMIGAHIDTWHVGGGNDNGAGVVVMMEAMRILKAIGVKPRRTIKIGLWGSEEQGLLGARGYVRDYLFDNEIKKPGFDKFSAYYNIDYGSGKIRGIYTMGNDALTPIFEAWIKPLEDLGVTTVSPRSSGGSDHVSFNSAGVNGLPFIQDRLDYGRGYHTNMDTYERMSIEDMKQIATVVAVFVYHTAQRDQLLPRRAAE